MKAIVTLTVPEGKRLIARAVGRMPEVRRALLEGRILLKGGSTTSAVAEELVGVQLRIAGRISPRGLLAAKVESDAPHYLLVDRSGWRAVRDDLRDVALDLGAGDVVITGANVIDASGGAALMVGAPLGGGMGTIASGLMAEGLTTIVVAGLEKLIPGTVSQAIQAAGRKQVSRSMGMAVGLVQICGRVITELEALKLLAHVDCQVIGKGGISGAEGGLALLVSGETSEVETIFAMVKELKGATTSGAAESFQDCGGAIAKCKQHRACIYRTGRSPDTSK